MVPHNLTNPLACNVMIVNKEGDLELYQVHDTPKQGAWSARGDLAIGAGMGLKVFEGFRSEEVSDEFQSDVVRQVSSRRYNISEKDRASRSRSAAEREDPYLRGRASKMPPGTPSTSALFGRDDEGFPPVSGVSAQLAFTSLSNAKRSKSRAYSSSPFRRHASGNDAAARNNGQRAGRKTSRSRDRNRSSSPGKGGKAKGAESRSRGVNSVLEDDMSIIMQKRALMGYGLSKVCHEPLL